MIAPADPRVPQHGKDGVHPQQAGVGLPAHGHQVDGVKPRVGDDARQDGGHPQPRLQKGGDEARAGPCRHGRRDGQDGVARGGEGDGHGGPQHEAPVGGQVGDVQDAVAQKQGHGHQGIQEAQLQRRLGDDQHKLLLLSGSGLDRALSYSSTAAPVLSDRGEAFAFCVSHSPEGGSQGMRNSRRWTAYANHPSENSASFLMRSLCRGGDLHQFAHVGEHRVVQT